MDPAAIRPPDDGGGPTATSRLERLVGVGLAYGPLTASIGIASLPDDVATGEDLLPAADRALYLAKRPGRNEIEMA